MLSSKVLILLSGTIALALVTGVSQISEVQAGEHLNGFLPDHYFSYVVNDKTDPEFKSFPIGLRDQFGQDVYNVVKPIRMYNPAQKNDEPIHDFETHLKAYKIRGETPKVQNHIHCNTWNYQCLHQT